MRGIKHLHCQNASFSSTIQKRASDPRPPPPPTYKAKNGAKIWTKYNPQCLKTRQTRQFCGHILVRIFALYVGLGFQNDSPTVVSEEQRFESGTEKQPKHEVFWAGCPADVQVDIQADVPAPKLSPHRSERRKIKLLARTSMTRRGLRTTYPADRKRGQRKGATPKTVKKCQKYFRHFSTFFAQGNKRQISSKSVRKFYDTFRQFSRGTSFPAPFGLI